MDQDWDQDLVIKPTNFYNRDSISVLMNNGDGTFSARVNYQTLPNIATIQILDLDGDFDLDLALRSLRAVSIFKNNGDGTFAARVDYSTTSDLNNFFLADLDADNDPDLVLVNYVSNHISVLKNNGDGIFSDQVDYQSGKNPSALKVIDLDQDADLDIAVANVGYYLGEPDSTLSIFINSGDGTFGSKTDYVPGLLPTQILAPDLDNDGDFDFALAGSGIFATLKNNGNGIFADKVIYPIETTSLILADFDVDGDQDLVAVPNLSTERVPNTFAFLANDGVGTFVPSGNYGIMGAWILTSDIDNDADIDFLTQYMHILTITKNTSNTICAFKPGDPNGDGKYNLVDIVNEVNIVFKGATKPTPACRIDANADGKSNLTDIIYLVNTIFKGGASPLPLGVCCL